MVICSSNAFQAVGRQLVSASFAMAGDRSPPIIRSLTEIKSFKLLNIETLIDIVDDLRQSLRH